MAERQGLQAARGAILPRTEFRTSFTSPEGLGKTHIFQGRVVNIDLVRWTVDVVSQFDQIRLLEIPVSAPYLHPNRGEGMYAVPEVGSKCVVCWPGDSSPPFVMGFVMPHEGIDTGEFIDSRDPDAGTTTYTYAGGRPRPKPGDIFLRGRDGQFVILHRGGILQIGSNELSQRLYIPLNNLIMDFAENYEMHNSGGSVTWGIQEGVGNDSLPTVKVQTFRIFANEKYADVRVAVGKVHIPVGEGSNGFETDIQQLGIGTSEAVVYELSLSKQGFKGEDGSLAPGAASNVKLRCFFDRAGNVFFKAMGNAFFGFNKKLRVRAREEIEVFGGKSLNVSIANDAKLSAGGTLELTGSVVRLNGGEKPIARVGDLVSVSLPVGLLMAGPGGPVPIPPGMTTIGTITLGNPTLLG